MGQETRDSLRKPFQCGRSAISLLQQQNRLILTIPLYPTFGYTGNSCEVDSKALKNRKNDLRFVFSCSVGLEADRSIIADATTANPPSDDNLNDDATHARKISAE